MKEAFRHLEVFSLMTSKFNGRLLIGCDDRVGEIRKSEECSDEAFQKVLTSSRPKLTTPWGKNRKRTLNCRIHLCVFVFFLLKAPVNTHYFQERREKSVIG